MNLGILTAYLKVNTIGFDKGLGAAQQKLVMAGQTMSRVGKGMTMGLTLPLVAVGAAATKTFSTFEANMSKITGLVGIAESQVNEWKTAILALAPAVGVGPEKLADAMYFITSAGVKGAEAMQVLEMSAKAAASGLGETSVIADLVTSAMNAYGKNVLGAAKATDILVTTVKEGKAGADQIAGAMGAILPIASAMGVQFDEVGAAIAGMTRTGTNADTAATQLKGMLSSILKPSKEAEDAFISMGTSSKELQNDLKNNGLLSVLKDLQEKTEGDSAAMAKILPNIRALSGMLDLMGGNAADNVKIFESLQNTTGALDRAFAAAGTTTKQTFAVAIATTKSTLVEFGGTIKEAVVPLVQGLGEKIGELGKWFEGLSESGKRTTMTLVGVVAAAGPLLMVFGKLMTVVPNLVGAFKKMSAALMANPWVIAVAAIAAVALSIRKVVKENNRLKDSMENAQVEITKQKMGMNALFNQLIHTEKGTKEYKETLNKLNTQYGEYLPRLLTERDSLNAIKVAREHANNELVRTILLQAKEAEIADQLKGVQKDQVSSINEATKAMQNMNIPIEAASQALGNLVAEIQKNGNASDLYFDSLNGGSKAAYLLRDELTALGFTTEEATSAAFSAFTATNNLIDALKRGEDIVTEVSMGYDSLSRAYESNTESNKKAQKITARKNALLEKQKKVIEDLESAQTQLDEATKSYNDSMADANSEYQLQLTLIGRMEDGIVKEIALLEAKQQKLQSEADAYKTLSNIDKFYSPAELAKLLDFTNEIENISKQLEALQSSLGMDSIELDYQVNMAVAGGNKEKQQQAYLDKLRDQLNLMKTIATQDGILTAEELANIAKLSAEMEALSATSQNTLAEKLQEVKDSLLSEEEVIRQSYANQIQIVEQAMAAGTLSASVGYQMISELLAKMDADLFANKGSVTGWAENWKNATEAIEDSVRSMALDTAVSLIGMAVSMKDSAAIGASILSGFADMMIQVGKIAIGVGMAAMGIKEALKNLNPYVALAAGATLVALGTVAKTSLANIADKGGLQGLATGTDMVSKSGSFLVGENGPEIAHLPRGSAVTPNGGLSHLAMGQGGTLTTRIAGRDLEIILNRSNSQSNLRRGY